MTFCCKLLLTPLPAEAANVVGTFTKKLMLRFLFFIELNNDFGVVDDSCIGVGGGGWAAGCPPTVGGVGEELAAGWREELARLARAA